MKFDEIMNMENEDNDEEEPFFMTNSEWYYYNESESKFKLTKKAPPEAIDSYNYFYRNKFGINGAYD